MTVPFYAEVFFQVTGRCLRMVSQDGQAGPIHCPEPVRWRGRFRDRQGGPTEWTPATVTAARSRMLGRSAHRKVQGDVQVHRIRG
jgi:hypothetical protein